MAHIINKIAFLVHVPNMYAHYSSIWEIMNRDQFVIVLMGSFLNQHMGKSLRTDEFIKKIQMFGYEFIYLDECIENNIKYKYVISNHRMGGVSKKRASLWFKTKQILKIIINPKKRINDNKIPGLDLAQYIPMQIGNKQIRFMYGADISDGWSLESWNEIYDLFLCHGPNDEAQLKKRFKGKTTIIGYPRYDAYFSNSLDVGNVIKEFDIDRKKKTILWMPTADLFNENVNSIPYYAKDLSNLNNKYNLIVRPHPISFVKEPEYIELLESLNYKIDGDPIRDMNKLYRVTDVVLCDHGGSAFGALYLRKRLVFLKTPANDNATVLKNSSNLELMQCFPVISNNDIEKFEILLCNDDYWEKSMDKSKFLFDKFFGDYRGTSSKRAVEILNSLDTILED